VFLACQFATARPVAVARREAARPTRRAPPPTPRVPAGLVASSLLCRTASSFRDGMPELDGERGISMSQLKQPRSLACHCTLQRRQAQAPRLELPSEISTSCTRCAAFFLSCALSNCRISSLANRRSCNLMLPTLLAAQLCSSRALFLNLQSKRRKGSTISSAHRQQRCTPGIPLVSATRPQKMELNL